MTHLALLFMLFTEPTQSNLVVKGPFQKTLTLQGEIISPKSEKFYTPRTKTWEIQLQWMLPEGTAVEPGDVVVRFDNSSVKEELENALNDLISKEIDRELKVMEVEQARRDQSLGVKEAEISLEKARIEASVPKGLEELRTYQEKQLALAKAEKELDRKNTSMETTLSNADIDLKVMDLSIADLEKKLADAERDQEKLQLKATTSGIVVWEDHPWEGRKLQLGETVRPSWAVARIPAMEDMEVEAYAAESELGGLAVGQTVTLTPDAYPNITMTGEVTAVTNNAVKRERFGKAPYFRITIKPHEVDATVIKPGMSVRSEILLMEREPALLIPIQMIAFRDGAYWVRLEGGEPQEVKPLGFNHFYVALDPGEHGFLKEGDGLEAVAPNE